MVVKSCYMCTNVYIAPPKEIEQVWAGCSKVIDYRWYPSTLMFVCILYRSVNIPSYAQDVPVVFTKKNANSMSTSSSSSSSQSVLIQSVRWSLVLHQPLPLQRKFRVSIDRHVAPLKLHLKMDKPWRTSRYTPVIQHRYRQWQSLVDHFNHFRLKPLMFHTDVSLPRGVSCLPVIL